MARSASPKAFDVTRIAGRFPGWSARSLKKGVADPTAPAPAEQQIRGASEESIAAFAAASKARKAHRRADRR